MIFPFSICLAERIVTATLCCSAKCYMSQATNPTHQRYKNLIIIKPCSTMQCDARLSFTVVYRRGRSGSVGVSVRGHDGAPGQSVVGRSGGGGKSGGGVAKVGQILGGLALVGKLLGGAAKHGHHGGHHGYHV